MQRQSRRGRPCGRGHIHSSPSTHDRNTRKITFLCTVSTTTNKKTFTSPRANYVYKNVRRMMNILVLTPFQLIAVTACSTISSDNDNLLNVYARHSSISVSAFPWEPQPDLARLIGFWFTAKWPLLWPPCVADADIIFLPCSFLWSPYVIGQTIIFSSCFFFFLSFFFFFLA